MNVFGSTLIGEQNKYILQLEQSHKLNIAKLHNLENLLSENNKSVKVKILQLDQSFKSFSSKFEHLLEENHNTVSIQEKELVKIQLTCVNITECMKKIDLDILENIYKLKNLERIIPVILSRLNTIETYYKDNT